MALLMLVVVVAVSGVAEAAQVESDEPGEREHNTSITLAPIFLIYPIAEVTVERRLPAGFGVAGIVAGGSNGSPVWEIGAQGRYYLLGDFSHGMPVLLEALYTGGQDSSLETGLMLGYKVAFAVGPTIDLAAGAAFSSFRGGLEKEAPIFGPAININLGWSF